MSRADRERTQGWVTWLTRNASRLGFRTLVSLLERLTPDAARVGEAGPVTSETILFRHDPALTFNSSDVTHLDFRAQRDPRSLDPEEGPLFEVTTSFLGLTGAATPLPHYLAEEVAQEQKESAPQRQFLDLFHHRLLSLLYRALSKYSVAAETHHEGEDAWTHRLLALGGIDTYDGHTRALPASSILRLLPLLALRSRTAAGLELALNDVLGPALEGAEVTVRQFVGEWVDIEERLRLGIVSHQLGRSAVLGAKVFDRGGKMTLCIGPLNAATYRRLLPAGDLLPWVAEVVGLFGWDPLSYDLELTLAVGAAPELRISHLPKVALGRDSWLGHTRERELSVRSRGLTPEELPSRLLDRAAIQAPARSA